MEIRQTAYYKKLTEPLRSTALKSNVTFSESGFTYVAEGLAICMNRESKNIYKVYVISAGEYESLSYGSQEAAIGAVMRIIALKKRGEL